VRAEDPEQRVDRIEDARDPAERQRRGAEAGHFPIGGVGIRAHPVHGIARGVLAVVGAVESGQWFAKRRVGHPRSHIAPELALAPDLKVGPTYGWLRSAQ
jgi:hypothetical protein